METATLIVVLVIVLALFFDFTNGFHDTANAMATPIATGALKPKVAVLIAAVNAIAVGYLVFSGQVADESSRLLDRLSEAPAELTLVALVLTTVVVIAMKALGGRGSPLRGGWPSGHAAIAFASSIVSWATPRLSTITRATAVAPSSSTSARAWMPSGSWASVST